MQNRGGWPARLSRACREAFPNGAPKAEPSVTHVTHDQLRYRIAI
jgi:hypothetical protein